MSYLQDSPPTLHVMNQEILAAAEHKWTVIDMAADWVTVHPDT